ncbi:MAG: hypothetical protein ACI9W2_004527 [Gammaproteobacteria bacterium]
MNCACAPVELRAKAVEMPCRREHDTPSSHKGHSSYERLDIGAVTFAVKRTTLQSQLPVKLDLCGKVGARRDASLAQLAATA